jgi:hypothetical protein
MTDDALAIYGGGRLVRCGGMREDSFIPFRAVEGMNMLAHAFAPGAETTRGAARTNLYLAATLVGARSRQAVTIRNLSASGALVRALVPFDFAGAVSLLRGSLSVGGTMAWTDGRNGGIHFDAPIDLGQWAPGASPGQRDVDRMVAQSRGQVAPLRPLRAPDVPVEERRANLVARIAEEIAFAARNLERLGGRLAEDPAVISRHASEVQHLDITAQALGHLTRLLASDAPEEQLAAIGMEDLRRRLERTSTLR